MGKRPNLAASVKAAAGLAPSREVMPISPSVVVHTPPQDVQAKATTGGSRAGRKAIYAWVDPVQHKRLKQLALETDRTIDSLVTEAVLNLLDKQEK